MRRGYPLSKDVIVQPAFNAKEASMRASLQHWLATGIAISAVGGLSFQAQATTVTPTLFKGSPTAAEVATVCHFPKVINKGGFTSPVVVRINNPPNNSTDTFPPLPLGDVFQVQITVNGTGSNKTFDFVDVSVDNISGTSTTTDSQFYDVRGTEAVVAESSSMSNIYCNVNSISDVGLKAPGSLAHISVFWVLGVSGFETQNDLNTVCGLLNGHVDPGPRTTDWFVNHEDVADAPVDASGCFSALRLCNNTDVGGDADVIPCPFGSAGTGVDLRTDTALVGNGTCRFGNTLVSPCP
jgi:hypothetical protein